MKFSAILFVQALAALVVAEDELSQLVHRTHPVVHPVVERQSPSSCSGNPPSTGPSSGGSSSGGSSYKRDEEALEPTATRTTREPHWNDMVKRMTLDPNGIVDITDDGYLVSLAGDMKTVIDEVQLSPEQIEQHARDTNTPSKVLVRDPQICSPRGGLCYQIRCYTNADCPPEPTCYFCSTGQDFVCR